MEHLTPKPTKMIERIIKASSNKNELVLDCFLGSGTTAVVSKRLNRKFIGCEQDKKYYQLSLKNFAETKKYRVVGVPFFDKSNENQFKENLLNALQT